MSVFTLDYKETDAATFRNLVDAIKAKDKRSKNLRGPYLDKRNDVYVILTGAANPLEQYVNYLELINSKVDIWYNKIIFDMGYMPIAHFPTTFINSREIFRNLSLSLKKIFADGYKLNLYSIKAISLLKPSEASLRGTYDMITKQSEFSEKTGYDSVIPIFKNEIEKIKDIV